MELAPLSGTLLWMGLGRATDADIENRFTKLRQTHFQGVTHLQIHVRFNGDGTIMPSEAAASRNRSRWIANATPIDPPGTASNRFIVPDHISPVVPNRSRIDAASALTRALRPEDRPNALVFGNVPPADVEMAIERGEPGDFNCED